MRSTSYCGLRHGFRPRGERGQKIIDKLMNGDKTRHKGRFYGDLWGWTLSLDEAIIYLFVCKSEHL